MRPLAILLLLPLVAVAQPPDFPAPKTFPPDDATLTKIKDKTAELKKATEKIANPDVLVYLKAAEWIVKHGEWFTEKSAAQTVAVLDAGLERAKNAEKKPWRDLRGKAIIRGYKSKVDGSVQPFSVRYPDDFDPKKKYRLDVVLHGRDATLTEVKFIAGKETAKAGKKLDHFEVEVYGRGNNAYRWAGERDVFEAIEAVKDTQAVDEKQIVLRGFSMGGAGTWHLGLHHPFTFAVMGPGAGFSTTREYIGEKKFGPQPDYIEKCLHIYDAVDYAENCFNIPVVAYSGEKDKQKLAADLIEAKLKDFKEPHSFTHVIAPGLEHSQPADWQAKLEVEYQKHLNTPRRVPEDHFRFVTYTTRYLSPDTRPWVSVRGLDEHYKRAVVDVRYDRAKDALTIKTENARVLRLDSPGDTFPAVEIDGQKPKLASADADNFLARSLRKVDGKWEALQSDEWEKRRETKPEKVRGLQGPIDDAFLDEFHVRSPIKPAWFEATGAFVTARYLEFDRNWEKHFRGKLPGNNPFAPGQGHEVLFGDPGSNEAIAEVLPKLPITWTKDKLVVNGKEYDPKAHVPTLIYPHPKRVGKYVVINSGHTFREADLKGTNALLYPRLGDWAVLKAKPTKEDPAGFEVIDAGLFDENWQFPKKK